MVPGLAVFATVTGQILKISLDLVLATLQHPLLELIVDLNHHVGDDLALFVTKLAIGVE